MGQVSWVLSQQRSVNEAHGKNVPLNPCGFVIPALWDCSDGSKGILGLELFRGGGNSVSVCPPRTELLSCLASLGAAELYNQVYQVGFSVQLISLF